MSYYFWAKLGLTAFYFGTLAALVYGHKVRGWHIDDVLLAGLGISIVLLATIVADLTYHA